MPVLSYLKAGCAGVSQEEFCGRSDYPGITLLSHWRSQTWYHQQQGKIWSSLNNSRSTQRGRTWLLRQQRVLEKAALPVKNLVVYLVVVMNVTCWKISVKSTVKDTMNDTLKDDTLKDIVKDTVKNTVKSTANREGSREG